MGLTRKHTWHGLGCFQGFCCIHVVETAVAVVRVPSGCKAALLLGRCSSIGGSLGKLLGALVGVMPNHSTLITSDGGLVLGGDGDGVASSPRALGLLLLV